MRERFRQSLTQGVITPVSLLPLLAALLGAIAAGIGALARGLPLPLDVIGVLLVIGLVATWVARARPWAGALFLLGLSTLVVGVLYVMPG
ncbi:MAG: hypothetical protein ACTHMA_18275 [Thermomicrobiales bacterium]